MHIQVSVRKANAEISAEQDGCTRMRGTVLRKPPRRRSGIIREMALVMSRPSVVPRYAVTVGSLKGGTVIGKTPEERGKLHLGV